MRNAGARPSADWRRPLSIALSVQVATSVMDMAVPVLGPAITASAGVPASYVGYYASAAAAGAILFYLCGAGLVRRTGPERTLQIGCLVSAGGLLLLLSQQWWLMLAAGLMVGLGFGTNAPASGLLLQGAVPQRRRRLAFSVKQAGAPFGALLAGLGLPFLAAAFTWQVALLAAATLGVVALVCIALSAPRTSRIVGSQGWTEAPADGLAWRVFLALLRRDPLRRLIAVGALLAFVQGSLNAFLVTYLVTELDLSIIFAGGLYAAFQAASIPGRILCGWLGDRQSFQANLLPVLGLASATAVVPLAFLTAGASVLAIVSIVLAAGFVAGSWNGVLLAEAAEAAPEDRVAEVQNVVAIGIFGGFLLGPLAFAVVVSAADYQIALIVLAIGAVLSAIVAKWA